MVIWYCLWLVPGLVFILAMTYLIIDCVLAIQSGEVSNPNISVPSLLDVITEFASLLIIGLIPIVNGIVTYALLRNYKEIRKEILHQ